MAEASAGSDPDEESVEEGNQSILMGMLSQLKAGMDLSRVTLPTFILEPRSFNERLTDFMLHPQLVLGVDREEDRMQRFLKVVRWYISGWHIRPRGVKKPYNPILGEKFRAEWHHDDGSKTFYVAEQVSHHPPVTAFHFVNRVHNIVVNGTVLPKSRFLGNSAASILEGEAVLHLLGCGDHYRMTFPSYYARGLLIGKLRMDTQGPVVIECRESGLVAELEFKNRGLFRGENNSIAGKVKHVGSKDALYTLSGRWDEVVSLQQGSKGTKEAFFDVREPVCKMVVPPLESQGEFESRRLWGEVTRCLRARHIDRATVEKTRLEDDQRRGAAERKRTGAEWVPHMFENCGDGDSYLFNGCIMRPYAADDVDAEAAAEASFMEVVGAGCLRHGGSIPA